MQRKLVIVAGIAIVVVALAAFSEMTNKVEAKSMHSNDISGNNDTIAPINERFDSLRDFLDWQNNMHERVADFPWYEETSPGLFKLHGSRGQKPDNHEYTESELREKLGFDQ